MRFFVIVCCCLISTAWAQAPFSYVDSIPVSREGRALRAAWCGGMHAPQFSSIDLDGDPFPDLYLYDQDGFRSLAFLNEGLSDSVAFSFDRSHGTLFPQELGRFTLLVDYDCDGKKDLFTRRGGPIAVYRNTGNGFVPTKFPLFSDDGGNLNAIFSRTGSLPAITDMDGDGDVDLLVLDPSGSLIWYHRNESQEMYGHCDSLVFSLADACWGNYSDGSLTTQPTLGISCRNGRPEALDERHPSGTTLTALDLDADGDKEVLHANFPAPNTFMLRNGGSPTSANMDTVVLYFPDYDVPVDIQVFPASFFEDVDNDGARDLIVEPFAVQQDQDNLKQSLFYKNVGTDPAPVFEQRKMDFLVDEMIDVGAKAHPLLLDLEGDGDLDLLIGNFGIDDTASLWLFRNTGSATAPAFEFETADYAGISALGLKDLVPCAGDLDGDGDLDMVLGEQNGLFYYLENQPQGNGEAQFLLPSNQLSDLDAGSNAQPILWDADGDNDLDLLVGRIDGELSLFENQGSPSSFSFADANEIEGWGGVDVQDLCCVGNAAPFVGDFQGQPHLFVGNDIGQIWNYEMGNVPLLLDSFLVGGRFLSLAGGDLNGDGDLELVVGEGSGGVEIIDFDKVVGSPEMQSTAPFSFIPYPNPATETLNFDLGTEEKDVLWTVWDLMGRKIVSGKAKNGKNSISIIGFRSGIYLLELKSADRHGIKRFSILGD